MEDAIQVVAICHYEEKGMVIIMTMRIINNLCISHQMPFRRTPPSRTQLSKAPPPQIVVHTSTNFPNSPGSFMVLPCSLLPLFPITVAALLPDLLKAPSPLHLSLSTTALFFMSVFSFYTPAIHGRIEYKQGPTQLSAWGNSWDVRAQLG